MACVLSACSYKIEITQGNPSLVEDFEKVQLGMTQDEVQAILKISQLQRLYKQNVWLYVYERRDPGFIGAYKAFSAELVFDNASKLIEINLLRNDFADDEEDDNSSDESDSDDGNES